MTLSRAIKFVKEREREIEREKEGGRGDGAIGRGKLKVKEISSGTHCLVWLSEIKRPTPTHIF